MRRWSSYGLRVIFTGQNQGGQLGCSSLDRNIWDGEKEIKTFATKLGKIRYLRIGVSSQRTFTLFHFFLQFQPLSGVTSQYRQYLSRVRDSLTHQVFYKLVIMYRYKHILVILISSKEMLTSKLQFRQRTVSISIYSGRIMTQVKYQINIFVRSISLSDQYICQINIFVRSISMSYQCNGHEQMNAVNIDDI